MLAHKIGHALPLPRLLFLLQGCLVGLRVLMLDLVISVHVLILTASFSGGGGAG